MVYMYQEFVAQRFLCPKFEHDALQLLKSTMSGNTEQ